MQGFMGKPEGKTPLGRPRCRWEDNIKMDLQEREWGQCCRNLRGSIHHELFKILTYLHAYLLQGAESSLRS